MKRREAARHIGSRCACEDSSYCSGSFSQFFEWISKTVRAHARTHARVRALVRSRSREDAHATKKQKQTKKKIRSAKKQKGQTFFSLRE